MTQIATTGRDRTRGTRWFRNAVAIGVLSIGAAACSQSPDPATTVAAVPDDYRVNHPITISETLEYLDVPVGLDTRYLPRGMDGNIAGFANGFLNSGSSAIAIVLPSGSGNVHTAAAIGVQIEQVFLRTGVPLGAIEYRSYQAVGQSAAPVRIAYPKLSAVGPECGPWTDNVAHNPTNQLMGNFGCATQHNLAAMVANPLDLLYPRMMPPPNAARRGNVLGNYQQGEPTNTVYEGDSAALAEVGE